MANQEFVQALMSLVREHMSVSAESSKTVNNDTNVYDVCKVSDENQPVFEDVAMAIHDGKAVRNISNPDHEHYLTGSAKIWVSNAGGKAKFMALTQHIVGSYMVEDNGPTDDAWGDFEVDTTFEVEPVSIPQMCVDLFRQRQENGTGFVSRIDLIEQGSFESKPFGVCITEHGKRYIIGNFSTKDTNVRAYNERSPVFKRVDKGSKGQRFKLSNDEVMVVFDPELTLPHPMG